MAPMRRALCEKCRVCFVPEIPEQDHCYRCLEEKKVNWDRQHLPNAKFKRCKHCKEIFGIISKNTKYCSTACRHAAAANRNEKKNIDYTYSVQQQKIAKANARWAEDKPKRKGASLHVLNRKAEYKRVFDDRGWDHYNKGRKWDRI